MQVFDFSTSIILYVLSLIIVIPGLIFFILGLVNKVKNQWTMGLAAIILSLILFFVALYMTMKFTTDMMKYSMEQGYQNMQTVDSLMEESSKPNTYDLIPENAQQYPVFMSQDGERYFLHFYLGENFSEKIEIIEILEKDITQTQEIAIDFLFKEDYKGNIQLRFYDYDGSIESISNSATLEVSAGETRRILFPVESDLDIDETEYCLIN
jgi:hypothetical protein